MRRVAMTHLPMRLELADARSRRCQHQPTPGGRPCALRWPRGHTHTRWAWRPSVSRRRPCSLSRPGAQERRCLHATPPSSARRAGSGGPHACGCGPGSGRAAGAASALGPRLDLHGSPGALQRPHWGGARFRVSPGACRCCPLSCGSGSNPSPRPSEEGSESPSAVTGACHFVCMPRRTASVRCCAAASRPSPSGGLAASLDPAAPLQAGYFSAPGGRRRS